MEFGWEAFCNWVAGYRSSRIERSTIAKLPNDSMTQLKNNSFVPNAPGHVFAVKVFEQWNGILARNAGNIFEFGHVDLAGLSFVLSEDLPQAFKGALVK